MMSMGYVSGAVSEVVSESNLRRQFWEEAYRGITWRRCLEEVSGEGVFGNSLEIFLEDISHCSALEKVFKGVVQRRCP